MNFILDPLHGLVSGVVSRICTHLGARRNLLLTAQSRALSVTCSNEDLGCSASKVSHLSKFLQHTEQLVLIDHSAICALALEGDLGGQLHALLRGRQACVA